jgi:F-type H+-transporting ATPase subunit b
MHLSTRVFHFALLAALTAGAVVAPFRVVAQQPAPAAQPAATTQGAPEAAKSEKAPKTEQEEMDVYRHAPIVQSAAKLLHLDLETTARMFEIINFSIIVLAVGIPLVRIFPKIIRKRTETLRSNIEAARKVTEDANTRLSAVEAKLSKLDEEIAQFRAEVEKEISQDEARIKGTIEEESARIVAAAEQEITVAAAHAQRGLRNFATEQAIELAAKQLVLSPETDRALIAEFVGDVAKGGQN